MTHTQLTEQNRQKWPHQFLACLSHTSSQPALLLLLGGAVTKPKPHLVTWHPGARAGQSSEHGHLVYFSGRGAGGTGRHPRHTGYENKASGAKSKVNPWYDANAFPVGSVCSLIHHPSPQQVLSTAFPASCKLKPTRYVLPAGMTQEESKRSPLTDTITRGGRSADAELPASGPSSSRCPGLRKPRLLLPPWKWAYPRDSKCSKNSGLQTQ